MNETEKFEESEVDFDRESSDVLKRARDLNFKSQLLVVKAESVGKTLDRLETELLPDVSPEEN